MFLYWQISPPICMIKIDTLLYHMLEQNIKDAMMVETLIKDYFQRQNVQTHSETAFNTVESKQPRFSRWILAKFLNFSSTSHNRTHNHNICVNHGEADIWKRKKRPIAPFVFNFQSSTKQWWLEKNPFNVMRVHLMRQMRCNCNGVPINCGFQKKTAEPPTIESSRRYLFKHENIKDVSRRYLLKH